MTFKQMNMRTASMFRSISAHSAREREFLLKEILQVRGLMPLLMKRRNKQPWSPEDKSELKVHLKRLSQLSPYLVVIVMPGGFFMLPALSWWLDRRRNRVVHPPR